MLRYVIFDFDGTLVDSLNVVIEERKETFPNDCRKAFDMGMRFAIKSVSL
jgi:beta-phosphoglucomutase-like phosphatase (HAD superfamily)